MRFVFSTNTLNLSILCFVSILLFETHLSLIFKHYQFHRAFFHILILFCITENFIDTKQQTLAFFNMMYIKVIYQADRQTLVDNLTALYEC